MKKLFCVVLIILPSALFSVSFKDNGDNTILDQKKGLIWQKLPQAENHQTMQWDEAFKHCATLLFAGHRDWRLPNRAELISLVNTAHENPSIHSGFFPWTKPAGYWTSSIDTFNKKRAWYVHFNKRHLDNQSRGYSSYVRCVREKSN